ncbi:hypothetical protein X801_00296 [Opisthorchis viverrini]|uniref:Uncharacterized protein n=1 Tax=Opisthorchis viverrini TaxID=6198 RepID=A0A1S8XAX0_OPIVI|nr:hypothetical protein X801_00296 [Opisthorchis viverrini]
MDPTYMTHGGTLGSYGQHKPQVATGAASQDTVVVQAPKSSKRRCPWYYWIISILLLAFLLALVLAISFSVEQLMYAFQLSCVNCGVALIEKDC